MLLLILLLLLLIINQSSSNTTNSSMRHIDIHVVVKGYFVSDGLRRVGEVGVFISPVLFVIFD